MGRDLDVQLAVAEVTDGRVLDRVRPRDEARLARQREDQRPGGVATTVAGSARSPARWRTSSSVAPASASERA